MAVSVPAQAPLWSLASPPRSRIVTLARDILFSKYTMNNTTAVPLAPVKSVRVFYVVRFRRGEAFSKLRGRYFASSSDTTVDTASQFSTARLAFAAIDDSRGGEAYEVVRVERTTVPGEVTPAKTIRSIVSPNGLTPARGVKYAICCMAGFFSNPCHTTPWIFGIDNAILYSTESLALQALQRHVIDSRYAWPCTELVKVTETVVPGTCEKDTVTDVLTVIE